MTTEKPTITWPDILNELYDNVIIQHLPPQAIALFHAIIYKFNKKRFRKALNISNTELQGLSHLTPKQFHKTRIELIDKLNKRLSDEYEYAFEDGFLTYKSSGSQGISGRYYLNWQPIHRRIMEERQANSRGTVEEQQENDNPQNQESFLQPVQNDGVFGKDPNITTTEPKHNNNEIINYNCNSKDDMEVKIDTKEVIRDLLVNNYPNMKKSAFNKLIRDYGWDNMFIVYELMRDKITDGENVYNPPGFFIEQLRILAGKAEVPY